MDSLGHLVEVRLELAPRDGAWTWAPWGWCPAGTQQERSGREQAHDACGWMPVAVPQRLAPLAQRLLYRLPKPTHWALASLLLRPELTIFLLVVFFLPHVDSENSPAGCVFYGSFQCGC